MNSGRYVVKIPKDTKILNEPLNYSYFVGIGIRRMEIMIKLLLGSGKNQIDLRYLLGSLEIKSKVILSLGL